MLHNYQAEVRRVFEWNSIISPFDLVGTLAFTQLQEKNKKTRTCSGSRKTTSQRSRFFLRSFIPCITAESPGSCSSSSRLTATDSRHAISWQSGNSRQPFCSAPPHAFTLLHETSSDVSEDCKSSDLQKVNSCVKNCSKSMANSENLC